MNEFHEAIVDPLLDLQVRCGYFCQGGTIPVDAVATTILAMSEMAAIRNLIHAVAMYGIGCIDSDAMLALYYELPESVVDWVHGDEVAS